jgi:hypothetical protein
MKRTTFAPIIAVTLAATVSAIAAGRAQSQAAGRWVTAWGTSQHAVGSSALANTTVRLNARVTIGGDAVRLRFDTRTRRGEDRPRVRQRPRSRTALSPGSNRPALFSGSETATTPPAAASAAIRSS